MSYPLKICIYCKNPLPLDYFSKDKSKKDGMNPRCRACYSTERKESWKKNRHRLLPARRADYNSNIDHYRAEKKRSYKKNRDVTCLRMKMDRKSNPLKYKSYTLKRDFGITLKDYQKMNNEQNGLCKICNKTNDYKYLAVDHCHKSNKIRGLLCENCNKGLGMFHDDIKLFYNAINYLQEYTNGK